MGVDAQMMFTMTQKPTTKRLKEIQYQLMARFGKEPFFCETSQDAEGNYQRDKKFPTMFLIPVEVYTQDGDDLIMPNMVEVKLWGRYYGEGYERGSGLEYVGIMLTLLNQSDIAQVYYGGDSSGICAEPYDVKVVELLEMFCKVGHFPYTRYFDRKPAGMAPLCSYCEIPMNQNGFGPRYAGFYCEGCGEHCGIRDDKFDAWEKGEAIALERFSGVAQKKRNAWE